MLFAHGIENCQIMGNNLGHIETDSSSVQITMLFIEHTVREEEKMSKRSKHQIMGLIGF